ncbi:MAG: DUF2586 family protein [Leeuwenhoekiella sp.]|uniref:DUF2586 family protein n=1 Tax=Leeuwenhoekiella sp. TaxID=1977054 RepID=UPI0032427052
MARPKLRVEKLNGGLGRRAPNADMVTGVVMNAVATADMTLGEIYTLNSVDDIKALGLDEAYDTENTVLVYHRLERLFIHNPSIIVHFMPVAQAVTLQEMADVDQNYLAKLIRSKSGAIVQAFIARNPDGAYVPTIEDGLNDEVVAATQKAQLLVDANFEKGRFFEVFVEGLNFTGTAAAALDLKALVPKCPNVSIVIMADNDVSKRNAAYAGYAAVEDFAALVSKAAVSQNAGEQIEDFSLTNADRKTFINAGLSSGLHIDDYTDSDLDVLNGKGYVFATAVSGIAGYYIVDTNTCTDDESDYKFVENNRTINKAIKLARTKLLPRIKGRLYVDPVTGQLAPEDRKDLEAATEEALDPMLADRDISGGVDAYIAPDQDVLATSRLDIELTFIPVAIGREIKLKIGFDNPLNN